MALKNILIGHAPRLYSHLLNLRSQMSKVPRAKLIRDYLESTPEPKLQLGSGRNYLKGWLNTDFLAKHPQFIYVDVSKKFPLPSDTFARIFSEHMLEHIPFAAFEWMVMECFRVLKPGGRLRLETPDLQRVCNLYALRNRDDAKSYFTWHHQQYGDKKYPATVCFAINNVMRHWGHIFIYDDEMLRLIMARAGFVDIKEMPYGKSDDPAFANASGRMGGVANNAFDTIAMEGSKPA